MYRQKYLVIAEMGNICTYLVTEYHSAVIEYSIVEVFLSAEKV
jgi:hypothetical protein